MLFDYTFPCNKGQHSDILLEHFSFHLHIPSVSHEPRISCNNVTSESDCQFSKRRRLVTSIQWN